MEERGKVKKVNVAREALDNLGKASAGLYIDEENKAENLVTTEDVLAKHKEVKFVLIGILVVLAIAMVIGFFVGKR